MRDTVFGVFEEITHAEEFCSCCGLEEVHDGWGLVALFKNRDKAEKHAAEYEREHGYDEIKVEEWEIR